MGVLDTIRERTGGARVRLGRELRGLYLAERRLAAQLRGHGARVPYPDLADTFTRLASQADGHAATLTGALRSIAGNADPFDTTPPRDGRNHWERLSLDLADLEGLQRRYTELALHWDVDFPAVATTLAGLARATVGSADAIRSMLARSDPHAVN